MIMKVEISVIMPVYNASKYISEAIESILKQTFKNFEFIIIDDGSTDNSKDIIEYYKRLDKRIKFFKQENSGVSKALNKGISIAKGKYIARMDSDDISLPHRLETQFKFMENNLDYVIIGSNANIISMEGNFLYCTEMQLLDEKIKNQLPVNPFIHPSTFIVKDSLIKAGGYDEVIVHHVEDQILWNKMTIYGKFGNLQEPLLNYRLLPTSISNRSAEQAQRLNILVNKAIKTGNFNKDIVDQIHLISTTSIKDRIANYYLSIGKIYLERRKNRYSALNYLLRSVLYNPFNKVTLLNIILCFLPNVIIKCWKDYRHQINEKKIRGR